jgi:hypothetical protein
LNFSLVATSKMSIMRILPSIDVPKNFSSR